MSRETKSNGTIPEEVVFANYAESKVLRERVLGHLYDQRGTVVPFQEIYDHVWGNKQYNLESEPGAILAVKLNALRQSLSKEESPYQIYTVPRIGISLAQVPNQNKAFFLKRKDLCGYHPDCDLAVLRLMMYHVTVEDKCYVSNDFTRKEEYVFKMLARRYDQEVMREQMFPLLFAGQEVTTREQNRRLNTIKSKLLSKLPDEYDITPKGIDGRLSGGYRLYRKDR